MFHNAVFGDNTTIVMGDGNRTTVRNSVKKGDFESLAAVLKHSGVTEEDIGYLQIAIQEDEGQVDTENEQTGPAVKRWLSNMMDKAINTAWNIELGVAAGPCLPMRCKRITSAETDLHSIGRRSRLSSVRHPTNHMPRRHKPRRRLAVPGLVVEEEIGSEFAQEVQLFGVSFELLSKPI
jgi:hypothetical protein